ncbi:MAG: hypothetical protein ACQGVC_00385 [Myxococcota bacterium]
MSDDPFAGLRVLQEEGRRGPGDGNLLLVDDTPGREALLKVYRRRGSATREWTRRFAYRVFERKRGVTARQRCSLERRHLALWREQGFDVPALLDRPLPEGCSPDTALWMEYCPGPLLYVFVRQRHEPLAERAAQVERYARDLGARQARALELEERGLIMKHASIKHVILCGDRQVSFDLEGRYADAWPMLDALSDELAAGLRSLLRVAPDGELEALGGAFLAGYGRRDQLRAIADFGLRGGGLHRGVRRFADRRRRRFSEYDTLLWVEERLGS